MLQRWWEVRFYYKRSDRRGTERWEGIESARTGLQADPGKILDETVKVQNTKSYPVRWNFWQCSFSVFEYFVQVPIVYRGVFWRCATSQERSVAKPSRSDQPETNRSMGELNHLWFQPWRDWFSGNIEESKRFSWRNQFSNPDPRANRGVDIESEIGLFSGKTLLRTNFLSDS